MYIKTYTVKPVYKTNANVLYYLKVTLDSYLYRYPTEAQYYQSFNLNVRNCEVIGFTQFS